MRPTYQDLSIPFKNALCERLDVIEELLRDLLSQDKRQQFYSIAEFALLVRRAEFTVREWCRLGRLNATKKASGRGPYQAWAITHAELLRFQREGLITPPRQ